MLLGCLAFVILLGNWNSEALSEQAVGLPGFEDGIDLLKSNNEGVEFTVWAQRHGAGEHNPRSHGGNGDKYMCDPTLTAAGIEQAKCAAKGQTKSGSVVAKLVTAITNGEVAFFSSPLARCIETAHTMIGELKKDKTKPKPPLTLLPSWREYTKLLFNRWHRVFRKKPYAAWGMGENLAKVLGECSKGDRDKIADLKTREGIQNAFQPFLTAMLTSDDALRQPYEDLADWGDKTVGDKLQQDLQKSGFKEERCCKSKGEGNPVKYGDNKFCSGVHGKAGTKKMKAYVPPDDATADTESKLTTAQKDARCVEIFNDKDIPIMESVCCRCEKDGSLQYFYSHSGTCSPCKGKFPVIKSSAGVCPKVKTNADAQVCSNKCKKLWGTIDSGIGDRVREAFAQTFAPIPTIFYSYANACKKSYFIQWCDLKKNLLTFYRSAMWTGDMSEENGYQAFVDLLTLANAQGKQKAYVATHSQTIQYFMYESFQKLIGGERVYTSPVTNKKYKFKGPTDGTQINAIAAVKPATAVIVSFTIKVKPSTGSDADYILEVSDAKSYPENHKAHLYDLPVAGKPGKCADLKKGH